MPRSVRDMSDSELEEAGKLRPWEDCLGSVGCALSPVLAALAVAAYMLHQRIPAALPNVVFIGIFWTLVPLLLFLGIAGLRSNPYHAELRRRYGDEPFAKRMKAAVKRLTAPNGPEWIVVLDGSALPHGGHVAIDIDLYASGEATGRITVTRGYYGSPLPDAGGGSTKGQDLSTEDVEKIVEALRGLQPFELHDIPHFVFDGFPFDIAALRRQPFVVTRAAGNLAGLPASEQTLPAAALALLALDLASKVSPTQQTVGWCDPFGNIGIGPV